MSKACSELSATRVVFGWVSWLFLRKDVLDVREPFFLALEFFFALFFAELCYSRVEPMFILAI